MSTTVTVSTDAADLEALKNPQTPDSTDNTDTTNPDNTDNTDGDNSTDDTTKDKTKLDIKDDPANADDAQVENILKSAGLDWDAVTAEFMENDDLTEDTRAKLTKAGFPKSMVDTYLEGARAKVSNYDNAVIAVAGSPEQYTAITTWAKGALTDAEKIAFNKATSSGDVDIAKLAVEGLVARYTAKNGKAPTKLQDGKSTGSTGVKPYASQAEVTADMRNLKYKTDPAFRQHVKERLAVSTAV